MSGPTPAHLARRGAVYFVRYRIPTDLIAALGIGEFRRSLLTKDPATARRRCASATAWFRSTMEELRSMSSPTRADFERAAARYFRTLNADLERPRHFSDEHFDAHVAENVELSRQRIADLEDQLRQNVFDGPVRIAVGLLAAMLNVNVDDLTEQQNVVAGQLVARAQREQHKRLVHQLLRPGEEFTGDPLFAQPVQSLSASAQAAQPTVPLKVHQAPSLGTLADAYLAKKKLTGVGSSQITELTRALGWLKEELGADRPVTGVAKSELREFRDGLVRLDASLRGTGAPFRDRQTNVRANQIKSATSTRYWKSIQAFFSWTVQEGHADSDPSVGLKIDIRKDDVKGTPPPFALQEIKHLFATPLFAGNKGARSPSTPGSERRRTGYWWSGVLSLFTGMRAGELSQLEPHNFHFDVDLPYVTVTNLDADGNPTRRIKNKASLRDIPLHPDLLELGLKEFVEGRAKRHPGQRLFFEFRLGSNGRASEGMTVFWGTYLRKFGLWKDGRSTHVFRHTVADRLRANGASDEDIGAILGHRGKTVTSGYGGVQPLSRKAATLLKLDYGPDLLSSLGGAYDKKRHG